jgi:hypothetical protein
MGGGSIGSGLGCNSNYIDLANSWMVYGPFSLVGATAAQFNLNLFLNTDTALDGLNRLDRACWMASTDAVHYYGNCISGESGGVFVQQTLDLSNVFTIGNLLGNPSVYVAVIFQSNGGTNLPEGALVDDIVLRKCTTGGCPAQNSPAAPDGSHLVQTNAMLSRSDAAQR